MPDSPSEGRLYDEEDVARILKKASERQSQRRAPQSGLTLDEIKEVAAEAGIDPRYVTDAAREILSMPAARLADVALTHRAVDKPNVWGGPLSVTRETVIDGVIDDFAWEEMVSEARREFNDTGEVRGWSNSREWASKVNNTRSHVTITTRAGKSRLQVFWSDPTYAVIPWVPALIVSLISLPIVLEGLALTGFLAAFVILSVVMMAASSARWVTSLIARRHQQKLDRLLARLEQIARLRAVPGLEESGSAIRDPIPSPRESSTTAASELPEQEQDDQWGDMGRGATGSKRNKNR